jgi:secretion/DNA translocation related TadE-like protein
VVAVAMMTVLLILTGGGALVGSAVIARHRAQAAADLGALAAATRVASGQREACATGASLVAAMRATTSRCVIEELDVVLTVEVPVGLGRWGLQVARASARAGPAP